MVVALTRPVLDDIPLYVAPGRVRQLDACDVPVVLREHATAALNAAFGPGEHWLTVGAYTRGGMRLRVTVRRVMTGAVQYGYDQYDSLASDAAPVVRGWLVCTVCADTRPDADVMQEGVSLGAQCVYADCAGTYADPS
jgi:hypothetical protein